MTEGHLQKDNPPSFSLFSKRIILKTAQHLGAVRVVPPGGFEALFFSCNFDSALAKDKKKTAYPV
jgi:hypothetical protein